MAGPSLDGPGLFRRLHAAARLTDPDAEKPPRAVDETATLQGRCKDVPRRKAIVLQDARKLVRNARDRAWPGTVSSSRRQDDRHLLCSPGLQVGLKPQQHRGPLGSHRGPLSGRGVIDGATSTDIGPYRPKAGG
jgi:hypothetical protein